jgi:uncharacterized membrane protein (DUF373 family)
MSSPTPPPEARNWIARAFTLVEDVIYIGLGLLLAGSGLVLLYGGILTFGQSVHEGKLPANVIGLLESIRLILLIVELLYTVQVSFREHALVPEPFLLVGLIAVIRRVLVLTAQFGEMREHSQADFEHFVIELGVLTALNVALAVSLVLLRKRGAPIAAERA